MSKNEGGQAFPAAVPDNAFYEIGMTLRDYFAAKALSGILPPIMSDECHRWKPEDFAREAYAISDAMLVERAK